MHWCWSPCVPRPYAMHRENPCACPLSPALCVCARHLFCSLWTLRAGARRAPYLPSEAFSFCCPARHHVHGCDPKALGGILVGLLKLF